jgi:hypothetical protein
MKACCAKIKFSYCKQIFLSMCVNEISLPHFEVTVCYFCGYNFKNIYLTAMACYRLGSENPLYMNSGKPTFLFALISDKL